MGNRTTGRAQPPHTLEAEQAVLGVLLLDPHALQRCGDLRAEHFIGAHHPEIFNAIRDCLDDGGVADLVTVDERMTRNGTGGNGTAAYLGSLAQNTPSARNVHRYAALVAEHARRRELAGLGAEIQARAARGDLAELRRDVIARLDALELGRAAGELRSVSFDEYSREYVPADYVIDPLFQRARLYALTALTGHGKTAIGTTLAMHLACSRTCGVLEVAAECKVLLLSGENDHDQQSRVIATSQEFGLNPGGRMRIIPGSYPIGPALDAIREEDRLHGPYSFIVADTSVAFFGGDDENDNPQLRAHAANFRELTRLPGRPAVLALCHPTKSATRDNLLPRGGGAFLNELDGNFGVWREGDRLILHIAGKFRGPAFDPITFSLKTVQLAGKLDARGRQVHSVVAVPLAEADAERLARQDWTDENRLLYEMLQTPDGSLATWARACAWTSTAGLPNKAKVHRLLESLADDKLVRRQRGRWLLTDQGKQEAMRAAK